MPKILKIEIEVDDQISAYRAVNILANEYKIKFAAWNGENWVFENPEQAKYFLKKNYVDLATGKEVKLKIASEIIN